MNETQRYLFDLQGYLHIPGLLSPSETAALLAATKALEERALAIRESPNASRWKSVWGPEYWRDEAHGWFAHGGNGRGETMMIEDFWLQPAAFDFLVGHPATLAMMTEILEPKFTINNSEIRIRYPGNHTGMHMGYPVNGFSKYRYDVHEGRIRCMMVRMIYFLHDVNADEGVTCFVPGSHLNHFPMPVRDCPVEKEPGVVGVPVKAGDGILFTEACRHGGFANLSQKTRYTLHVGYGPGFMGSQNISTMDERPQVTDALMSRLSEAQRALLAIPTRRRL